eukprot:Nk52_evm8s805 gene=Nk52_evmTU8s805
MIRLMSKVCTNGVGRMGVYLPTRITNISRKFIPFQKVTLMHTQATAGKTSFKTSSSSSWIARLSGIVGVSAVAGGGILYYLGKNVEDSGAKSALPRRVPVPPEMAKKLRALLKDRFENGEEDCEEFSADLSFHEPVLPHAVVYPVNEEEVQKIVKMCNDYKVPIVSYGGGTSLEGHIIPVRGGICICMSNMDKIVKVYPGDLTVEVQPGVKWETLNEELEPYGLFFAMDPGQGATIGGMAGTSCSGTNAVRYGTMKENVVCMRVVLANGEVIRTGQRAWKSSAGYDLTHLFVGSEGTLGVTTSVTLKLNRIPDSEAVAVCHFPSLRKAAEAVAEIRSGKKGGIPLTCIELIDDCMIKAINDYSGMSYPEKATLFFKFSGHPDELKHQVSRVREIANDFSGSGFVYGDNEQECEKLWQARRSALWAARNLYPDKESMITDVCVPFTKLPEVVEETKEDIKKSKLQAPLIGHVGDGNFHLMVGVNTEDAQEVKNVEDFSHRLVMRAIKADGTCTGEHGVGIGKVDYLVDEFGKSSVEFMVLLKASIDPNGIMNPGKVIPMNMKKMVIN